MDQRTDQGQLLLHAVGIGAHCAAQIPGETEQISVFTDPLFPLPFGNLENVSDKIQILNP